MRICLVTHGFPPIERTGVENYTHGLARALARAGHAVEVFSPRRDPGLLEHSLRREEHGGWAVNWVTTNRVPAGPREMLVVPGIAAVFGAFLDRERPEVVHFQHLIKVGVGLVQEARRRGIPTVYTAHDYYPICHRYTLLRPDLSRCDVRGDSMACARCDLALAHLNRCEGLGDYQIGALPGQLSERSREVLAAILADETERAGLALDTVDAAFDLRLELDGLRAQAFAGVDLVLAPTEHLAAELVRGGIERAKIEVLSYGIENSDLVGLAPIRPDARAPVRFAFLGGLSKHKGVHVLLEAFPRVGSGAELTIWGDSTDRPYVELVRRDAARSGARWGGAYERRGLARILTGVDAAIVPSIWVENQPIVIREAFSARRPVLASRLGALPEGVRDGVDGLLFEPEDPEDLARCMRRCVQDPDLLSRLAAGIQPVKGIDEQVGELLQRYERLTARVRRPSPAPELPASLRDFQARHAELSALPARALLRGILTGLEDLRAAWADELGQVGAVELLASGLGEACQAQDRLREARAEIAWLRAKNTELVVEDLERMVGGLRSAVGRRPGQRGQAGAEDDQHDVKAHLRAAEEILRRKEEHLKRVEGQLVDATRHIEDKEQQLERVEEELRTAGEYVRGKEEELRTAGEYVRGKEEELRTAGEYARGKEEELRTVGEYARGKEEELRTAGAYARRKEEDLNRTHEELRKVEQALGEQGRALEESEARSRFGEERARTIQEYLRATAELGVTAIQAQERLLGRFLLPILGRVHRLANPGTEPELPSEDAHFAELLLALRQALRKLEDVERELAWRRATLYWRLKNAARKRLPRLARFPVLGRVIGGRREGGPEDSRGERS